MRDDAPRLFTSPVLPSFVDEAAGRPSRVILERVPREGCRKQTLARQRERNSTDINRDPASAPLLGDMGGRPAAASRVEYEVAGVGGHQHTTLNELLTRLNDVET